METVDDSGFDSDQKSVSNGSFSPQNGEATKDNRSEVPKERPSSFPVSGYKPSELQKKIEKQREKTKKKAIVDEQPKKSFILPRNRLNIPSKPATLPVSHDQQPLVAIMSDDSEEDEFAVPALSKEAQKEITEQLIKDGYDLDLEPDDEDLDLIPPRPLHERCACCPSQTWLPTNKCAVQ